MEDVNMKTEITKLPQCCRAHNFLQKKSYAVHYFRVDTCIYKGFRRSILILLIYSRFYT